MNSNKCLSCNSINSSKALFCKSCGFSFQISLLSNSRITNWLIVTGFVAYIGGALLAIPVYLYSSSFEVLDYTVSKELIYFISTIPFQLLSSLAGILFFAWIYRTYKNLIAIKVRKLEFEPSTAIGYFFIPLLNFYKPHKIFQELWKVSSFSAYEANAGDWNSVKDSSLIRWWWLLVLLSIIIQIPTMFITEIPLMVVGQQLGLSVFFDNLIMIPALILGSIMLLRLNYRFENMFSSLKDNNQPVIEQI